MASNNPPLLEVKNLRVEFPTRRGTLLAVDDVSFDIAPGEVLGVVGESGAGKSLTGNAIIGLLEPPGRIAGGEVKLEGRRIDNLPYEEMRKVRGARIGAIFQDPLTSLNPLYSVGRQLVETIQTHKSISASAARARALALLKEVGIPGAESRIDHYPHQFSGGMRQRVMIAMALANEPDVLIADVEADKTDKAGVRVKALQSAARQPQGPCRSARRDCHCPHRTRPGGRGCRRSGRPPAGCGRPSMESIRAR